MMSKTHLMIGMAAALAGMKNDNITGISDCLIALAGGALGGAIPDIDILDNHKKHDAPLGESVAFGFLFVAAVIDILTHGGMCSNILNNKTLAAAGLAGLIVLCIKGYHSGHRGFTHSLLSLILFSFSVGLIYKPLGFAFALGYISHLALDTLNKKEIKLFYPCKSGICFKLCGADGSVNRVLLILGFISTAALLIGKMWYTVKYSIGRY